MSVTFALLRLLQESRLGPKELSPIISSRLKRLLSKASTVPFYRQVIQQAGYIPALDYSGPADLSIFPVTRKSDIKANPMVFVQTAEAMRLDQYFSDRTSGSTGTPLAVYRAPRERAIQIAKWLRVMILNGYRPTDKVFSCTSPGRLAEGKSLIQLFGLFRRLAIDYTLPTKVLVDAIINYSPQVIYGVRTSLVLTAEELLRRGLTVSGLNMIIAGGEVIDPYARKLCLQAFGHDIIETYGTVEMGVMAYQHRQKSGLNLIEDCTYFEFLDAQDQPVGPGQLGRVVVTDLYGGLMPFIRYDQGDWATFRIQENEQGELIRVIDRIVGRQEDLAPLPDGHFLTYLDFYELMDLYSCIVRFRVRQRALDEFVLELVTSTDYFRSIEQELRRRLNALSDLPLRFEINLVDRISPDPSGKLRMLVSEVSR